MMIPSITLPTEQKYKEMLLLAVTALLLYIPFSSKPFHIDSPVTVYIAEQILVNPLNPPAGEYGPLLWPWNHTELTEKSAFRATPHPPLISYWAAVVIRIFGADELIVNWSFFPFYLGTILFFYLLCGLFGIRSACTVSLLFAVSPALYINAQNVMYDVPLTMFCIGCFYFLFRSDRRGDALLAGVFAGMACLVKFTAGTLVIAGALYFLLKRDTKGLLLFLCTAALFNLLWMFHNIYFLHGWQLTQNGHATYIPGDIRYRFERMVSYIGAGFMLPPCIVYLWWKTRTLRITGLALGCGVMLWSVLLVIVVHYSATSALVYCICAFAGVLLLLQIPAFARSAVNGKTSAVNTVLTLHMVLQIVGGLFLTLYASRYSLPFIFILIIMAAKTAEQFLPVGSQKNFWKIAIGFSLALSIMMSVSDYQIVNAEKQAASAIRKKYPDDEVFFKGRLGYLYYMHHAGAKSLTSRENRPGNGNLVVRNCFYEKDDGDFFSENASRLQLIDSLVYPVFPFRTIGGRAGFYGNDRLPFAWVQTPKYRLFQIFRVR
jgi:4-amino-4-deoxy-L-arabinose transferase-like glycosyltransferase